MGDVTIFGGAGNAVEVWPAGVSAGASYSVDAISPGGTQAEVTLTANTAITVGAMVDNAVLDLLVHQDATGGRQPTWAGVDVWMTSDGNAPSFAASASSTDEVVVRRINGVKYGYWLTPQATVSGVVPYRSGSRYWSSGGAGVLLAMTLNRLYMRPYFIGAPVDIAGMSVEVTTAAATAIIRMGIVSFVTSGAHTGEPSILYGEVATPADASSTGPKPQNFAAPIHFSAGWVYLAAVNQGAAVTVRGISSDMTGGNFLDNTTTIGANSSSYYQPTVTGAIPSPVTFSGAGNSATVAPRIAIIPA